LLLVGTERAERRNSGNLSLNVENLSLTAGAGSDPLFDVQPCPLLEVLFEPAREASSVGWRLRSRQ